MLGSTHSPFEENYGDYGDYVKTAQKIVQKYIQNPLFSPKASSQLFDWILKTSLKR